LLTCKNEDTAQTDQLPVARQGYQQNNNTAIIIYEEQMQSASSAVSETSTQPNHSAI
jgi:hypothetical protein